MKRVISVLAILSLLIPLSARAVSISNPLDSPLYSVSYYGRFADVFANPAALPLIETETGPFAVSTVFSDDYDASLFHSQPLSMLNKQKWDLSASFIADYIALTAFYGTAFDKYSDDPSLYDIRSSLRIELDMAYAIPHFSFGTRISGGNSMIRQSKRITGFFDIFANAWFSPFERESGSESFDVGVGFLFYIGPFSLGAYTGKVITLEDNDIYLGWDAIGESTTISASLSRGRFTSEGDLALFRPRVSYSITGFTSDDALRTIEASAELTFQFLPSSSATIAVSYLETEHSFFLYNAENGYVGVFLRGEWEGLSVTLGVTFSAVEPSHFAPYVGLSFVS